MNFIKQHILDNYDQEAVMAEYFDVGIEDVRYALNRGCSIINSLRYERVPSLSFRWYGRKLIARDFGDINYRGDIFEIAATTLGVNVNSAEGFIKVCNDIMARMENINSKLKRLKKEVEERSYEEELIKTNCDISPIYRNFTKYDFEYFAKYGIGKNLAMANFKPIQYYYINDYKSYYRTVHIDPCYSWIPNPGKMKLYFPLRPKSQVRFISNNRFPIENIDELIYSDYLIFIKARKDKVLLKKIIDVLSISNIQVLSLSSETVRLPKDIVDIVDKRISKQIFTCLDNDEAGIKAMEYYKDVYRFEPILPTRGWHQKDITDLCKQLRFDKVKDIVEVELKQHCKLKYNV